MWINYALGLLLFFFILPRPNQIAQISHFLTFCFTHNTNYWLFHNINVIEKKIAEVKQRKWRGKNNNPKRVDMLIAHSCFVQKAFKFTNNTIVILVLLCFFPLLSFSSSSSKVIKTYRVENGMWTTFQVKYENRWKILFKWFQNWFQTKRDGKKWR